jgi:hypothetical protein
MWNRFEGQTSLDQVIGDKRHAGTSCGRPARAAPTAGCTLAHAPVQHQGKQL